MTPSWACPPSPKYPSDNRDYKKIRRLDAKPAIRVPLEQWDEWEDVRSLLGGGVDDVTHATVLIWLLDYVQDKKTDMRLLQALSLIRNVHGVAGCSREMKLDQHHHLQQEQVDSDGVMVQVRCDPYVGSLLINYDTKNYSLLLLLFVIIHQVRRALLWKQTQRTT